MPVHKLAPSMMCADFMHLSRDVDILIKNKVEYLHIDIMDGHYVPNFTLGVDYCKSLAAYTPIPLDIHLMIENVDAYAPAFCQFKNAMVSFHPEVSYHPIRTIQLIKSFGVRVGIGIDPAMPLESVKDMLPEVDMICVMTVSPGYAGQKVIPHAIDKMREITDHIAEKGYKIEIEVDGNVSWENLPLMLKAGAETFVAGSSSLFEKGGNLHENIARFRRICAESAKK
jgi:ribulose-phosphate 3-epimerase